MNVVEVALEIAENVLRESAQMPLRAVTEIGRGWQDEEEAELFDTEPQPAA